MFSLIKKYSSLSTLKKASIWFIICNCIQSGVKFLSLPIFANILDLKDFGIVTLYTSWMSIIFIFATFALGRANGVYYVAMVRYPKDKELFTTAMEGLTVILCLVCFGAIYASTLLFGNWMGIGIEHYPAMCIELIGYGIVLLWSLRMRYDYAYTPLILMTIAYSFSSIIFPIIGISFCPNGVSRALMKNWCSAIASILVGFVALFLSMRKSRSLINLKYWKFAIGFNMPLIPHYLSNTILIQSDRIMIAFLISESYAAIYNVAYI